MATGLTSALSAGDQIVPPKRNSGNDEPAGDGTLASPRGAVAGPHRAGSRLQRRRAPAENGQAPQSGLFSTRAPTVPREASGWGLGMWTVQRWWAQPGGASVPAVTLPEASPGPTGLGRRQEPLKPGAGPGASLAQAPAPAGDRWGRPWAPGGGWGARPASESRVDNRVDAPRSLCTTAEGKDSCQGHGHPTRAPQPHPRACTGCRAVGLVVLGRRACGRGRGCWTRSSDLKNLPELLAVPPFLLLGAPGGCGQQPPLREGGAGWLARSRVKGAARRWGAGSMGRELSPGHGGAHGCASAPRGAPTPAEVHGCSR